VSLVRDRNKEVTSTLRSRLITFLNIVLRIADSGPQTQQSQTTNLDQCYPVLMLSVCSSAVTLCPLCVLQPCVTVLESDQWHDGSHYAAREWRPPWDIQTNVLTGWRLLEAGGKGCFGPNYSPYLYFICFVVWRGNPRYLITGWLDICEPIKNIYLCLLLARHCRVIARLLSGMKTEGHVASR
jgi:hypothetical protein